MTSRQSEVGRAPATTPASCTLCRIWTLEDSSYYEELALTLKALSRQRGRDFRIFPRLPELPFCFVMASGVRKLAANLAYARRSAKCLGLGEVASSISRILQTVAEQEAKVAATAAHVATQTDSSVGGASA